MSSNKIIVYQLLNLSTAERSQALSGVASQVRSQLEMMVPEENREKFSVIVLLDGEDPMDIEFSRCPVLSVSQFLQVESLKA